MPSRTSTDLTSSDRFATPSPPAADAELLPRARAICLIDEHGTAHEDPEYARPDDATLITALRELIIGRRVNEQAGALVRQGRLAVYPSSRGQEACEVAAALALTERDWLFPTYRDAVAAIARGIDPVQVFTGLRGDWHCGFDPHRRGVAPPATPLATHLLHADGFAHAARLRGEDTVVLAICGDGATSEGDFHEALNFAAVFALPVVFLVQNNGYAISVPLSRQTHAASLAHKAIGYGMPGRMVDGNDVAALLAVLGEAVTRARSGGGPTLVEAITYRMESHTNADDASRYRSDEEVRAWQGRDPVDRLRVYLTDAGIISAGDEAAMHAQAEAVATRLREGMAEAAREDPAELFDHVYAGIPQHLARQRDALRAELDTSETEAKR